MTNREQSESESDQVRVLTQTLVRIHRRRLIQISLTVLDCKNLLDAKAIANYSISEAIIAARMGQLKILGNKSIDHIVVHDIPSLCKKMTAFLDIIVLRKSYDHNRQATHYAIDNNDSVLSGAVDRRTATPEESAVSRERESFFKIAISELSKDDATLLTLSFFTEGVSEADVANALGMPPSTYRSQKSRLLNRLRNNPTFLQAHQDLLQDKRTDSDSSGDTNEKQ